MQENTQVQTTPPLSGPSLVDQVNKALETIGSDFSGSADPASVAWSYATWADTGTNRWRRRNAAGTAWVDLGPLLAEATTPVDGALYASQSWVSAQISSRAGMPVYAYASIPTTDIGPIAVTGATSPGIWTWSSSAYAPRTPVAVRQTVLAGAVNASMVANFLSAGAGLTAAVSASTVPLRIAFAAGSDSQGPIDYVFSQTSNVSVGGLSASTTNYIYAERNASTGAVTFGATTVAPQYVYGAASVANGAHTYVIPEGKMYLGNGTTATAVQRVFLGEVVTNASAVVSAVSYAYQGQFVTTTSSVPSSSRVAANHNLGCIPQVWRGLLVNAVSEKGYSVGDEVPFSSVSSGTTNPFMTISESVDRRGIYAVSNSSVIAVFDKSGGSWTAITLSSWQTKFYASRGW